MAEKAARKTSFQWGSATIGVRELTISDDARIMRLLNTVNSGEALDGDSPNFSVWYEWAEFQIAAVISGESPVPLADESSSMAALEASLRAWEAMPRKFGRQWRVAISAKEGSDDDPN